MTTAEAAVAPSCERTLPRLVLILCDGQGEGGRYCRSFLFDVLLMGFVAFGRALATRCGRAFSRAFGCFGVVVTEGDR